MITIYDKFNTVSITTDGENVIPENLDERSTKLIKKQLSMFNFIHDNIFTGCRMKLEVNLVVAIFEIFWVHISKDLVEEYNTHCIQAGKKPVFMVKDIDSFLKFMEENVNICGGRGGISCHKKGPYWFMNRDKDVQKNYTILFEFERFLKEKFENGRNGLRATLSVA